MTQDGRADRGAAAPDPAGATLPDAGTLVLAFEEDALQLLAPGQGAGAGRMATLAAVPIDAEGCADGRALRRAAGEGATAPVTLWLAASQVATAPVRLPRGAPLAHEDLATLAERVTGQAARDLALALAPLDDDGGEEGRPALLLAAFAQTVAEARRYALDWGFLPLAVSTDLARRPETAGLAPLPLPGPPLVPFGEIAHAEAPRDAARLGPATAGAGVAGSVSGARRDRPAAAPIPQPRVAGGGQSPVVLAASIALLMGTGLGFGAFWMLDGRSDGDAADGRGAAVARATGAAATGATMPAAGVAVAPAVAALPPRPVVIEVSLADAPPRAGSPAALPARAATPGQPSVPMLPAGLPPAPPWAAPAALAPDPTRRTDPPGTPRPPALTGAAPQAETALGPVVTPATPPGRPEAIMTAFAAPLTAAPRAPRPGDDALPAMPPAPAFLARPEADEAGQLLPLAPLTVLPAGPTGPAMPAGDEGPPPATAPAFADLLDVPPDAAPGSSPLPPAAPRAPAVAETGTDAGTGTEDETLLTAADVPLPPPTPAGSRPLSAGDAEDGETAEAEAAADAEAAATLAPDGISESGPAAAPLPPSRGDVPAEEARRAALGTATGAALSVPAALTPASPAGSSAIAEAALIGVMTLDGKRQALMRLGSGRYHRVEVGDSLGGWQIEAIADDRIRLHDGQRERLLPLMTR